MKNSFIKYLVFATGILCILLGVGACLFDKVAGGGVIVAAGILLILMSQFDIEYFKMPGLEAKLRQTIVEAEVTLEALRKVTVPISEISVSLAARNGRMGVASSHSELYTLAKRIEKELLEIKVPQSDIDKVLHDWFFFTSFDMGRGITEVFINFLEEKKKIFAQEVADWLGGKPISDHIKFEEKSLPVQSANIEIEVARACLWKKNYQEIPKIISSLLNTCKTLDSSEKELLWKKVDEQWQDLNHFVNYKELRRKEVWFETEI